MDINTIFKETGESVSNVTAKVVNYLISLGFPVQKTTAKIISLLIILGLIYAVFTFATSLKTPIKVGIIILLIFLAISLMITII